VPLPSGIHLSLEHEILFIPQPQAMQPEQNENGMNHKQPKIKDFHVILLKLRGREILPAHKTESKIMSDWERNNVTEIFRGLKRHRVSMEFTEPWECFPVEQVNSLICDERQQILMLRDVVNVERRDTTSGRVANPHPMIHGFIIYNNHFSLPKENLKNVGEEHPPPRSRLFLSEKLHDGLENQRVGEDRSA
jgi:hypothetical protein